MLLPVKVWLPTVHVKLLAPPAVNVAGLEAQTRLEELLAATGNGATETVVIAVVMPQPFWPETV